MRNALHLFQAALFMSAAHGVDVTRGGPVDVQRLTRMINTVYKKGEEGIISDTEKRPFARFMESDVQGLLDSDALLLARSTDVDSADEVVGCVKLDLGVSQDGVPTGERVGEWGGLAVGEAHQGRGVARALVSAAEAELRAAGCTLAQLELLAPAHWKRGRRFEHALGGGHYACPTTPVCLPSRGVTQPACERPRYEGSPTITPLLTTRHDHKERLHAWYVARLGYGLQVPGDYMASTTRLPRGTLLLGRFELAVESDFTVYRRRLSAEELPII